MRECEYEKKTKYGGNSRRVTVRRSLGIGRKDTASVASLGSWDVARTPSRKNFSAIGSKDHMIQRKPNTRRTCEESMLNIRA